MLKKSNRNYTLDLIRCLAIFCVISVHFFKNSGFYTTTVFDKIELSNPDNLILLSGYIARTFFMICVPLFITLTGYLMNKKKLQKSYYYGIIKVLFIYILSTVLILLFRIYYLKERFSKPAIIYNFFNFEQYSWYVKMYIGLFLLLPFLNIIYNNLSSFKSKLILVITFFIIAILPSINNVIPTVITVIPKKGTVVSLFLFPNWWKTIYPLAYYFLGAFLNEYYDKVKINTILNIILLAFVSIGSGILIYSKCLGKTFDWKYGDYNSAIVYLETFLVFNLLLRVKVASFPNFIIKIIVFFSNVSFGAYLISYCFDNILYPILLKNVSFWQLRFKYFIIIVPLVMLCSSLISYLMLLIYKIFNKLFFSKIFKKR